MDTGIVIALVVVIFADSVIGNINAIVIVIAIGIGIVIVLVIALFFSH